MQSHDKELACQLRAEYLEAVAKWNHTSTFKERKDLLSQIDEIEKKLTDLLFKTKPSVRKSTAERGMR